MPAHRAGSALRAAPSGDDHGGLDVPQHWQLSGGHPFPQADGGSVTGHPAVKTVPAMQPGRPQGAGLLSGVPVVALPGNPVSALVSFEVFVRPALRAAMGFHPPTRPTAMRTLAKPVDARRGIHQFRLGIPGPEGTLTVLSGHKSHGTTPWTRSSGGRRSAECCR
jgi:hypothetical protein